jgi:hypothetical protein
MIVASGKFHAPTPSLPLKGPLVSTGGSVGTRNGLDTLGREISWPNWETLRDYWHLQPLPLPIQRPKLDPDNLLSETSCRFWTTFCFGGCVWFSLPITKFQYRIEAQVNGNLRWHKTSNVTYVVRSPNCDSALITVQSSIRPFHERSDM